MSSDSSQTARPLCLLIVDDDALNQSMMNLMLSPEGYSLEFASDGAEALEVIQTRPHDLVFLDLVLPDMNGRDVAQKVRQWEAGRSHVPIVAVTAYDLPGQPLELVKAGIDDYVFKPFNLRSLTRMIKLYAGNGKQDQDAALNENPSTLMEAPVLDYRGSLLDFSNDVAGYEELLKDFVAALPERLVRMHEAQTNNDLVRMGRDCHSLKGVAAGLGAIRLSILATQLGKACAAADSASTVEMLKQLELGVTDLQAEVRLVLEP